MRATESIRFCITMVDYKMHSQKISALATPKKGVIFHVENWCRMKGPPQYEISEAPIHLAYVQHLWQSKTCCCFGRLDQVED